MNIKKFISLSPFIGLFLLILIHPVVSELEELKYYCLFFIIISFLGWKYIKGTPKFKFSHWDWSWFALLGYSLLSFFWATDPALIWNVSFYYMLLFLGVLALRQVDMTILTLKRFHQLFSILFVIFFLHCLTFLCITYFCESPLRIDLTQGFLGTISNAIGLPSKQLNIYLHSIISWNYLLGRNWNFVCLFYLSLFPFFLYKKNSSVILNFFAGIIGMVLIFKSRCLGAGLIAVVLLFLGVWFKYGHLRKIMHLKYIGSFTLIGMIVLGIFQKTLTSILSGLDEMRWYQIRKSIDLLIDSNFIGVGSGNWHLFAYDEVLTDISGFDHSIVFIRMFNHNMPSQLLGEVGIVGFLSFLIPFLVLTYKSFRKSEVLNGFDKACFLSVCVFFIGSNFYGAQSMNVRFFSEINLVTWIAFGLLSNKLFKLSSFNKIHYIWPVIFALISSIWIYFYHNAKQIYDDAQEQKVHDSIYCFDYVHKDIWTIEPEFEIPVQEIVNNLETLYNPYFNTSFYNDDFITLRIGTVAYYAKDYEKAKYWFDEALKKAPNNEMVLMNLAHYYLNVEDNPEVALSYTTKVYKRQTNHEGANILMAEILINLEQWEKAKEHINSIDPFKTRYSNYCKILLAEIYYKTDQKDEAIKQLSEVKSNLPRIKELKEKYELLLSRE